MIELKNVSKKYGKTKAVKEISLTMPQGQIIGLFGENGAGKTTLLKCILGLLSHEGTVTLDGAPLTEKNIERTHRFRQRAHPSGYSPHPATGP